MTRILNWLFSRTKLGHWVDGNKRLIGFGLWLLGVLIELLGEAALFFPDTPILLTIRTGLIGLKQGVSEALQTLGVSVMAVGVAHAAAKEKQSKNV